MEYRDNESHRQCQAQYQVIVNFRPELRIKMVDNSINVTVGVSIFKPHLYVSDSALQFKTGLRLARASDAKKLKELAVQLASTMVAPINVDQCSRVRLWNP